MCIPLDDASLSCWLFTQLRVLDAWCDELANEPDTDIARIEALERHRNWLADELARVDQRFRGSVH